MLQKLKQNSKASYLYVFCFLLFNIFALLRCQFDYTYFSALTILILSTGIYLLVLNREVDVYFKYFKASLLVILVYESFSLIVFSKASHLYASIFFRNINLIACLTVCVYLLYFQNLLKSRRLLVIFFVLTAVFLIYLNSRVAIFSFVLCNGLLFFASIKYSLLEKGGKALYFLISILLVTGIFLLTQKSGSTTGRLFIYKVVFLNFKSYFLGGGVNSFTEIYPGYLKGYFEITGVTNLDDLANVTVPEYAYNEFLQIFIELGLVELLLFSVSFFPVLNRKRLLHDTKYLCVLVLLLNSFVSYTFHNAILYTLLIILLAVIHKEHLLSQSVILPNRLVTNVVSILLITTGSLLGIVYYHFHNLKMKTTHNSNASCTELKNDYFCLDKVYKRDSKFINNYSKAMLYNCNDTILATNILKKAKKEIPEYENLLLLGEIYFSRNLIDSAELNFKEAVKYLPNRFIPLYYLQNISLLKGDTIKAKLYAERILYLPVKIPSIDITIAKLNAENFMKILK